MRQAWKEIGAGSLRLILWYYNTMMLKILTDRVGFQDDVKQVRQEWLRDLFSYIGLDVNGMDELEPPEILEYFLDNEVEVIDHKSIDGLEVRFEGELVGEWGGPDLTLKRDKDGSLFFEATIECWSIMEEEINDNME